MGCVIDWNRIFWVVSVPLAIIVAIIFLSGELTDERRQKVRDWFHAWKVWLLIRRTGRFKDGWRSSDIELRLEDGSLRRRNKRPI